MSRNSLDQNRGMTHLSSLWLLLHFFSLDLLKSQVTCSMDDPRLGTWSDWSQWSGCSRSCGGGAKMRTRVCKMSSRAYFGGVARKSCSGENVEYELCSVQNCPSGSKEFLEYQCSLRDGQRGIEWIPYPYGQNPCELQCWSADRTMVHSFGKAIDGTKCATLDEPGEPALCINGRCMGVDCAGQIGRDNRRDRCGVCRGNNATCVHRRYVHEGRPRDWTSEGRRHYEYDRIATIPSGATEISVREDSKTNFLALSDERGDYHVNSNWRIQSPGRILIHGTEFLYDRSWNGTESLRAHGPTRFDTSVYVLGTGDVPPVHIEYWISDDNPHQQMPLFPVSNQMKDSLEINRIEDGLPRKPYSPVVRFQGYRSYYHRNEILKSVPSWSAKRQAVRKNPPVRRIDVQSDVASTTVTNGDAFRPDRRYVHRPDPRTFWTYGVSQNATRNTTRYDGRYVVNTIPSAKLQRKYGSPLRSYQREVSATARPNAISESSDGSGSRRHLKKKDKYLVDKKRNLNKKKRKSGNDDCQSCPKPKQQKKSFCASDFVLRAVMLSVQKLDNSFRYELQIVQSFKNRVPISAREYVWTTSAPAPCRCPRLRTEHEYILMGRSGSSGRESRLFLDADSFARQYTPKRARTLQRLVRDQNRICKKT